MLARRVRASLIGLLTLVVGACTPAVTPGPVTGVGTSAATTAAASSATATVTPAGPIPAGLETYYRQQLKWAFCEGYGSDPDALSALLTTPGLQCARMTVPLDYDAPQGRSTTIALVRKVATGPTRRIGSLIIDPGGPGVSGVAFVAGWLAYAESGNGGVVSAPWVALNRSFDLVGIDPRGVGNSTPAITCQSDKEKDAARAIVFRSATSAEVAAANAVTQAFVTACVHNTGAAQGIDGKTFLAHVGTRDVARDLDVLRGVLGDEKLTYLGLSYGTAIGWEYAEQFPQNVRALLFDGVIDPTVDENQLTLRAAKGLQDAFEDFAAWCATQARCPLGRDPTKAVTVFHELVRPLLSKSIKLRDGRSMSFNDAVSATTYVLYLPSLRPNLVTGLLDLAAGYGEVLMDLADQYNGRASDALYTNESDALNMITCVDYPHRTDPVQVTAYNRAYDAAAPYQAVGDPAGPILDPCAYVPVSPTLRPHVLHVSGLPQTLVISNTGDPVTPYTGGVELAKEISARLLTVKAVRHGSALGYGDTCVDGTATAYLIDLKLPALGAICGP